MYSSPLIILLCQILKAGNTSILESQFQTVVTESSAQIINNFDCRDQEKHTQLLTKFPQIISTWVIYDIQYSHLQDLSCQIFEVESEGNIFFIVDGQIEEFLVSSFNERRIASFSNMQHQELQSVEALFDFCAQKRKKIPLNTL